MPTVYEQLSRAGVELDHHESDLYARVTPESRAIVEAYEFRNNVTTFRSQIDGTPWYDVPFAYDPYWTNGRNRLDEFNRLIATLTRD
jgi:hypothetical protein